VPSSPIAVNSYTTGEQRRPAVAQTSDGSFVVVWESQNQIGGLSGYDIFFQRFGGDGQGQGMETPVNAYTTGDQSDASVCMDGSGNFVVAWEGEGSGDADGVWVRSFFSDGGATGPQMLVNTYTTGSQESAEAACAAGGRFVIVWRGPSSADSDGGIAGKLFAGIPAEFQVNTYTTGFVYAAALSVASDDTGNFVVVWEDPAGDLARRRFDSTATPLDAFQVATYTGASATCFVDVARHSDGDFVVVWNDNSVNYGHDVLGMRFDSNGVQQGALHEQSVGNSGRNPVSTVFAHPDGDFIVAWNNNNGDELAGRVYEPPAAATPSRFEVASSNPGYASSSRPNIDMASDEMGHFVVVWDEYVSSTEPKHEIMVQRFRLMQLVFGDGFESGDTTMWSSAVP
jgi:hypothetical protein